MKRLLSFAIVTLALMVAAQAQYRPSGPPASVTSTQQNAPPGSPVFSGPGPSVTSGSFTPVFPRNRGVVPHRHGRGRGSRGVGNGQGRFATPFAPDWAFAPGFVPVPVPVPVDANGNPIDQVDAQGAAEEEDEAPAYTVFEHRSRSAIPPVSYMDSPPSWAYSQQSAQQPEPAVPDQPATVLIFRDGHQLEITNYAIQSGTLFNLSDNGPRKIALADLDVDKTVKANDARGVDFTLPAAR